MENLYNLILNNEEAFMQNVVKGRYYDNTIPWKDRLSIYEDEDGKEVNFKLVDDGEGVSHFYIFLNKEHLKTYRDYFEVDFLGQHLFIHWFDEWMD